jgi:hypothetical protein
VQGKGYDLGTDPGLTAYFRGLINKLLGQHLPVDLAAELGQVWQLNLPSYRVDLADEERL